MLGPIRYINVNFPVADRELYEWAEATAKKRHQRKSQFMRSLLEEAKELAEAKALAEARDGSA